MKTKEEKGIDLYLELLESIDDRPLEARDLVEGGYLPFYLEGREEIGYPSGVEDEVKLVVRRLAKVGDTIPFKKEVEDFRGLLLERLL